MMSLDELVASLDALRREDLEAWMQCALVAADDVAGTPHFSEMECARVQLICTLHYDMEVEVDTLPVVLDLIDQLHEVRYRLNSMTSAIMQQDDEVRTRIMTRLQDM